MLRFALVCCCVALALCCGMSTAAEPLKSGPQVGDKFPGPFHPFNVFNAELSDQCGKKNCLVCQHGVNPVAMVFARKTNEGLAILAKKLDEAVVANKNDKMGAFIVFLTEGEKDAEKQVKDFIDANKLKNISLAIDNPAGPDKYNVSKDAEVTVVFYNKRDFKANHAFAAGKFDKAAAEKVAGDVSLICGKK